MEDASSNTEVGSSTDLVVPVSDLVQPSYDSETGIITVPTQIAGVNLSFFPDTDVLSPKQMIVLEPMGIDPEWPARHVAAWLMDCQARGFVPGVEAYLMRYKTRQGPRFIHHIGIAGFRKHAAKTHQYRGHSQPVFYAEDGSHHKVWLRRGEVPAACEITVFRDGFANEPTVALYDEYAPMQDVWEYDPAQGRDVKTDRRVPIPMWRAGSDGGKVTVMLAKVAEAAGTRHAFPNEFAGWYAREEMAVAANEALEHAGEDDQTIRRRESYRMATQKPAADVDGEEIGVTVQDAPAPVAEPAPAVDVDQDDAELMSEPRVRELLLAELGEQAAIIGRSNTWMVSKWAQVRGVAPEQFRLAPVGEIAAHVRRWREYVVGKLREQGRHEAADHYAHAAPLVGDVDALFGPTYNTTSGDLVTLQAAA